MVKISFSKFFLERNQLDTTPYQNQPMAFLEAIKANWGDKKVGYRKGVYLVPINPKGFYSDIAIIKQNHKLLVSYSNRVKDELPRKTIYLNVPKPPAESVWVVVYHTKLLKGLGESNPTKKQLAGPYQIITILSQVGPNPSPMTPETLMYNHFGGNGGTLTKMSSKAFEKALKISFEFWKDKAMISKT